MSRLLEFLRSGRVLLMDGAMGTELQNAGLLPGECAEQWNLTHADRVREIHLSYHRAGSRCFLTNTFQSHPAVLGKHHLADQLEVMNQAAVGLARSVAGPDGFVLGDIGPISSKASLEEAELQSTFRVARSLATADGLLFETWSDFSTFLLVNATRQFLTTFARVPIMVSFTFLRDRSGKLTTFDGRSAQDCARSAREAGIEGLGVNCGREIGMDEIIEILRVYRQETDMPLLARPNAGTPVRIGDHWKYPRGPEEMAARLPELLDAGVSMVGGCCGTTPDHLAAFRPIIEKWNQGREKEIPGHRPGPQSLSDSPSLPRAITTK
jgi:5-methyltetrahydrofolate--homocysteine methyltransferase